MLGEVLHFNNKKNYKGISNFSLKLIGDLQNYNATEPTSK